jgi:MFS family permease
VDTPKVFFPGRRTLPKAAAFWILAGLFLMLFFASAAASPLYPVYQVRFRFSAATLTAVFAVYVLVLLVTLLFFGKVSDHVGRLPVIITALVFSVAGCAVFLAAHGVGALYVARSLQGIATGLASGPIGAALIELQPAGSQRAPLVTSAFSTLGLGLGALITSALVQYAPAPTRLIWWALLAVFAAGIVAVLAMAEPGSQRPGVLASLRPTIAVPRRARATFAGAVPCFIATWALGGLYLSLGPSLAAAATGSPNLLWGGLVIFLICGTGAVAAFALRGIGSRAAMLAGCLLLFAGVAVTFGAIATTTSAAFLAGTAVAGAGFGLGFSGAFRMTMALATPSQSADRWRSDHEVRAALDGPGLLRFARRPGRGGGRDPAVRPFRQGRPGGPGLARGHTTGPVHRSAMPAGHRPIGRQPGNDRQTLWLALAPGKPPSASMGRNAEPRSERAEGRHSLNRNSPSVRPAD